MTHSAILVSVLTPTWNRASYLERVWKGLITQSHRGFEWIVADDGSTDGTEQVVRELALRSEFPVVFIRASRHVGKARMDNESVARARGEFILWCDSDDYLQPNAVSRLLEAWASIPADARAEFVGAAALCASNKGTMPNPFPGRPYVDVSWNDLAAVHGVTADMLFFTRASVLKAHPFPEVDLVIPESVVWTAIGHQKARLIPDVLKINEYNAPNGISFSGRMAYNRGRAHALAAITRNMHRYPQAWRTDAWRIVTFLRYCLHGEVPLGEARQLWGGNSSSISFWTALPVAWVLATRDTLQGKVSRTHREFLSARESAAISVEDIGHA